MAEEDIDNDTVFVEGSPLYELFKNNDVGLGDFETTRKSSESYTNPSDKKTNSTNKPPWLECIKDKLKRFEPLTFLFEEANNWPIYENVSSLLVDSKLLHSEDESLLKGFLEERNFKNTFSKVNRDQECLKKWLIYSNLLLVILVCSDIFWSQLSITDSVIFYLLFVPCLCLDVLYMIRRYRIELLYDRRIDFTTKLDSFVTNLKEFWKLNRKGLRCVQESEIIARGLTFASVKNTLLEVKSVLPSRYREKQCPELRSSVFKYCRKHFEGCREATGSLLKIFPLTEGFDVASHYLSNMKLEELGPLVCTDVDSEELLEITEHFSTPALKAIIELTRAQQSEFLRRIAFCFLSDKNSIEIFNRVIKSMNLISLDLNMAKSGLDKILLYYSLLGRNIERKREPLSDNPIQSFRTSLRSTSLHLQAALIRLQDIENQLEKNENEEFSVLKDIIKISGMSCLTAVQSELVTAKVCYEDTLARSLRIIEGEPTKDVPQKPFIQLNTELEKDKVPPLNLIEMGDPVVEDQVFEGSAEYLPDNIDEYDDFPPKLSKKGPAILLNELKTVLAVKAEERKVREAKVLGIDPSEIPDTQISTPMTPDDLTKKTNYSESILSNESFEELKMKATSASSSFMTSIAAQAALRSQMFGGVNCCEDIIADSDSE